MATYAVSPGIAVRARGSNECPKHHGKEVVFYCKNCGYLVCADCSIQECQGHEFEGINNVTPASKQKLQDFIIKAELTEIPSIRSQLQTAESELTKNKNHFKNQITKIRNQNEAIKKELDRITETFEKTYQDMVQQNTDELLYYKRNLKTRIDKLTYQIQDAKETLQSKNDILVFDMSHVIKSKFDDLPTKPDCTTPEFALGELSVQALEPLLGFLNISVQTQSPNQPENRKVVSEFTPYTGHAAKSICVTAAGDHAWFSFFNTKTNNTIQKVLFTDQSGQVKQTLDMDVRVTSFCISRDTNDIWLCLAQDKSVREVKGGKSVIRFTTNTKAFCICLTKDDHIMLGHERQIVKYTQRGHVMYRTSGGNPPVVRSPVHLSECPLTSNLAVVDWNWKEHGGNGKAFVSILDDQLQLLCIFTGEGQGLLPPTRSFSPKDVCFTGTGKLVIADWGNKSVLLVTGTGRYLITLYTNGKSGPLAVGVHSGALWVSFDDGSVRVLKSI